MLTPPSKGFATSVNVHNVKVDALAEWIEGCVTFDEKVISRIDVVDMLIDEQVYRKQDFAKIQVGNAWDELEHRRKCLGPACSFEVASSNIRQVKDWKDTAAYSFCLMLALQVSYRSHFVKAFGTDYTEQGLLFERLTKESLATVGLSTHSTGWSKASANTIRDKVIALGKHLNEPHRDTAVDRWTDEHAKDGGLDVVCHLPFIDQRAGRPIYYVQCASGENWREKRATPVLSLWDKLVDLATRPTRGLSMPFVLLEDDFRKAVNYDDLSLLLDRHRICMPVQNLSHPWLSVGLAKDLNKWTASRLKVLFKAKSN